MDFRFSAEDEQFRQDVRTLLERAWPPEYRVAGHDDWGSHQFRERQAGFRKALANEGWFSMGIPEEYGGIAGFSQIQRYIVTDECSRIGAPLPPYLVSIMGPVIMKYGTPWMKNELLTKIRSGDIDFVFGLTEPENGSDLANLQTRATRDGDEFVINGSKLYGHPHDNYYIMLAVRTDPDAPKRRGISLLFVEYEREGLTTVQLPTLARGNVGATYYDNVRVPADHLIGEENHGWQYLREILDLDRTSGIVYGYLGPRVDDIIRFVKETTVDGASLIDDPWVRDRVAQLVIEFEAGEVLQHMTASKIAAGMELRVESSIVKLFLTELGRRIGELGMELAGPLAAVLPEHELAPYDGWIHNLWESNVASTIAGGSNEIQRNIIAFQGLNLPRE